MSQALLLNDEQEVEPAPRGGRPSITLSRWPGSTIREIAKAGRYDE
jgi:hypothetical protein